MERERENKGKEESVTRGQKEGRKSQRRTNEKNLSMFMMSSIMNSVLIDFTAYS